MAEANRMLGQPRALIFMGAEGEPELYADRQKVIVKQQDDSIHHVAYPAAGLDTYPRQAMDLKLIQAAFSAMLAGEASGREMAVIKRMNEALRWASVAEWPATWTMEVS